MKKIILTTIMFLSTTFTSEALIPKLIQPPSVGYWAMAFTTDQTTNARTYHIINTETLGECISSFNIITHLPNVTILSYCNEGIAP